MANEWTPIKKRIFADSLDRFCRSRPTRRLAQSRGYRLSSETVNELCLQLLKNERFVALVTSSNDREEIQRIVHYYARFYLRNLIKKDSQNRIPANPEAESTTDPSKRLNGSPFAVKHCHPPLDESREYLVKILLDCLPETLRPTVKMRAKGYSFDEIGVELAICPRTARRRFNKAVRLLRSSIIEN